jgi:hypothetical protein
MEEPVSSRIRGPFLDAKRNRQWRKLNRMYTALERGDFGHVMADIKWEMCELIRAEVRAFPDFYLPNGGWGLIAPNVLPFPRRS